MGARGGDPQAPPLHSPEHASCPLPGFATCGAHWAVRAVWQGPWSLSYLSYVPGEAQASSLSLPAGFWRAPLYPRHPIFPGASSPGN